MDTVGYLKELCLTSEQNWMLIDSVYSSDQEKCLKAIMFMKNNVIGSNKQKENVIERGVVPRLLQLILDETVKEPLCYECIAIICSLSKGTPEHLRVIINVGTVPVLITKITDPQSSSKLVEISLRALRSIFTSSYAPIDLIYDSKAFEVPFVTFLLELASSTHIWAIQECIANILANSCQTTEHQTALCGYGAIQMVANLMLSPAYKVKIPALELLAAICHQNEDASEVAFTTVANGKDIPQILTELMNQENTPTMQFNAAKCMTYIHRACGIVGNINAVEHEIVHKTLPTLVRMCEKDKEPCIRAASAHILAYLTEVDTELQRTAAICNHIIPTLADFFKYQSPCQVTVNKSTIQSNAASLQDDASSMSDSETNLKEEEIKLTIGQEMKEAALKAFASLAANEEDTRKKIIETDMLMEHIINGLSDPNVKIRLAALRCLHSLSRSVQQLRTTFQDHHVWIPLKSLLNNATDDVLIVVSSTLCNLLLEFSPSKEHFLDRNAVERLCSLTQREEKALRLNGVWALMNMAFQADQNIKNQILSCLGTNQIFKLLSDSDSTIVMKTLGLIRNLLSTKYHIDQIMSTHGKQLMQAVNMALDDENVVEIKEQALCILANIASGNTSKEFIMSNEEVLKKLLNFMINSNVKLQIAAVFCISNLLWKEEDGAAKRQAKLKEMGVKSALKQLLHTQDTALFDKAKTALDQFSNFP